jgi:mevalonate kinase
MTVVSASAPGKIILCGEHAVVYGRPAIAVPVTQVSANVSIATTGRELTIEARDQNRTVRFGDLPPDDPLAAIIRLTLDKLGVADSPVATITIQSTIPIAGGLGSGAAVSAALVRALAAFYKHELDAATISPLVYEVERLHHGTPSGIDNTVIVFGRPVYFVRGQPIELLSVPHPFHLIIADTGIASPTKIAVSDVRAAWQADPAKYESLFDRCGEVARQARALIESGQPNGLGPLMTNNHAYLREMGVSCPELDSLVEAAMRGGALGAKLSGAGRGGNVIALITAGRAEGVERALLSAGAKRVINTVISGKVNSEQ